MISHKQPITEQVRCSIFHNVTLMNSNHNEHYPTDELEHIPSHLISTWTFVADSYFPAQFE